MAKAKVTQAAVAAAAILELNIRGLLTQDLFTISKIIKKLNIRQELGALLDDPEIKKQAATKEDKAQQQKYMGLQLGFMIVENMHQAERELSQLMADLAGIEPDIIPLLPIGKTIEIITGIFSQEGIVDFLKLAAR